MKRWHLPITVFLITLTLLLAGEAVLMAAARTHSTISGGEAAFSIEVTEGELLLSSFGEEHALSLPHGALTRLVPPPIRALCALVKAERDMLADRFKNE